MKLLRTVSATLLLIATAFAAQADPIAPDTLYELHNHPDGNARPPLYGLRLDGLTTGNQSDIFTFEFGGGDTPITMFWDSAANTLLITGEVYGGQNDNNGGYLEGQATWWTVNFLYTGLGACSDGSGICANVGEGSIASDLFGSFDLVAESGHHPYAFQLDTGHRGFDGISGWGWLNHCPSEGNDGIGGSCDTHLYASDWLFTAKPVPEPATLALMGFGLLALAWRSRQRSLARAAAKS